MRKRNKGASASGRQSIRVPREKTLASFSLSGVNSCIFGF